MKLNYEMTKLKYFVTSCCADRHTYTKPDLLMTSNPFLAFWFLWRLHLFCSVLSFQQLCVNQFWFKRFWGRPRGFKQWGLQMLSNFFTFGVWDITPLSIATHARWVCSMAGLRLSVECDKAGVVPLKMLWIPPPTRKWLLKFGGKHGDLGSCTYRCQAELGCGWIEPVLRSIKHSWVVVSLFFNCYLQSLPRLACTSTRP